MRTVTRAVRHGALTRSEIPEVLLPELDKRLAQPDATPFTVFGGRHVAFGVLAIASGVAWAAFLVWAVVTDGLPRKFGGNVLVAAVLVAAGAETAWSARHWRKDRNLMKESLRKEGQSALAELMR